MKTFEKKDKTLIPYEGAKDLREALNCEYAQAWYIVDRGITKETDLPFVLRVPKSRTHKPKDYQTRSYAGEWRNKQLRKRFEKHAKYNAFIQELEAMGKPE